MEMTWPIVKMILVLGMVLVTLFYLSKLLKVRRGVGRPSTDSVIRVLASQSLAPQKTISLVEIGGEVLALGISETQISLLAKIENREFIEKISSQPPSPLKLEGFSLLHSFQPIFTKPKTAKGGWWRRMYAK